jgi:hypothetical protein
MSRRGRTRSCALIAVALLALPGCGGDDKKQQSTTLTRSELIAKGDALCKEYNDKQAQLGQPKTIKQLAQQGKTLLPVQEDIGRRFKQLKPADAERPAFDRVVAAQEKLAALNRDRYAAATRNDAGRVKTITADFRRAYGPYVKAAREVGFKVCATG